MTTTLRGITWDHPRGLSPLVATASDVPGVRIVWSARSLQAFGDQPIGELAESYDLIVLDHPWVGQAARAGALVALDELLDADSLGALARASVGPSFASYRWFGHQWALPLDAAAQVAAYRPDLIDAPPRTWDEALDIERLGMPLVPVDCMMSFLSLCVDFGERPGADPGQLVDDGVARGALALLRALRDRAQPQCALESPIGLLDRMAATDEVAYAPLTFGYVSYARAGFRNRPLRFAASPSRSGGPLGAVLGGAGIAISSRCAERKAAAAYALRVASKTVQQGAYLQAGGQPAHRAAWTTLEAERLAPGFFASTLSALDQAYLRPRFAGFLAVQNGGGILLHRHLFDGASEDDTLAGLERLWRVAVAGAGPDAPG